MWRNCLTLAAAALTACGGGNAPDPSAALPAPLSIANQPASSAAPAPSTPTQLSLTPASANIAMGGSVQFSIEGLPVDVPGAVTWSLSGPACVTGGCGTVDAAGRYAAPVSAPGISALTLTATLTSDRGISASSVITLVPQAAGTFSRAGNMRARRAGHTATLLADGRVLIAGGDAVSPLPGRTAEIYDPATGTFAATGNMSTPRTGHTATLLANGQVLIAGPDTTAGAEIYDPGTGTFLSTGAMLARQNILTASLLKDGNVLVTGDASGQLYDVGSRTFRVADASATFYYTPTATVLADGRVLFVGGDSTQLYDPPSDTSTATGSLEPLGIDWLELHSATLLTDGRVLIAGGANDEFSGGRVERAELYDPATGTFSSTGNLVLARSAHAAVRLRDGQVLVLGGDGVSGVYYAGSLASAELYSPSIGSFAAVGSMNFARTSPVVTLLQNGDVLITGGISICAFGMPCPLTVLAEAEIYRPR